MSLEVLKIPAQKPKEHVTTPEILESLEKGVEIGMEHLAKKNMTMLEKAELITSPKKQKEIVMKLGRGPIEAAKAIQGLKEELRAIEKSKLN